LTDPGNDPPAPSDSPSDPASSESASRPPIRYPSNVWLTPALLTVTFLLGLTGLLWLIQQQSDARHRAELQSTIRAVQSAIEDRLRSNEHYVDVTRQSAGADLATSDDVRRLLDQYIATHPELLLIAYIHPNRTIAWAAPATTGQSLIGLSADAAAPAEALERAERLGTSVYSRPFSTLAGERGFAMIVPAGPETGGGLLSMVYSADRLLRHLTPREAMMEHHVELVDAEGRPVANLPSTRPTDESLTTIAPLDVREASLTRYRVKLTRYDPTFWNWLLGLLLLICVGLFAGMAFGMWSLRREVARRHHAEVELRTAHDLLEKRVRQRTIDLERANQQLQEEMLERRRAEERAREHQEQLTYVARVGTMGEMASGLAHELNQPLGAIASFSDGAVHMIDRNHSDPEKLRPVFCEIGAQARHAGRLIHRLRELVAQDSPQKTPQHLPPLTEEVLVLVRTQLKQRGVEIRTDIPDDLPPLMIDRIQIQQVLLNLAQNASEAMKDSPRRVLTIAAHQVDDERVEIRISDTGKGCDDPTLARLFDPFFSTRDEGMGMGLAICRSIVESHESDLLVERNASGGLTFFFFLPFAERSHA